MKDLYQKLMKLVANLEAFYYKDFEFDGHVYRIFSYRLASYTDFCQPGALECRGIMYEVNDSGEPLRLASLPMEKFFNLNENPFTMNLDMSEVDWFEQKADGSLMSTYLHRIEDIRQLRLKSKGSIESEQCLHAMTFLNEERNAKFVWELETLAMTNYTINLEWCAPQHRIVLGYDTPQLNVLNIRDNITGDYVPYEEVWEERDVYPEIIKRWIPRATARCEPEAFVKMIPDMTDIEGFIVVMKSGQRVKVKTLWYLALHHSKDSINSPRRLFEAVLEEATDDLRSLFADDKVAIGMIEEMEAFVEKKYNHMVDTVERFYERNKRLERKDYAILGQEELPKMYFGLAMSRYLGKEVDYKTFLKGKWKDLGLKDKESEE